MKQNYFITEENIFTWTQIFCLIYFLFISRKMNESNKNRFLT
jgi:hypothetical protein